MIHRNKPLVIVQLPCPHPACQRTLFLKCIKEMDTLKICPCENYWVKISWAQHLRPSESLETSTYYAVIHEMIRPL